MRSGCHGYLVYQTLVTLCTVEPKEKLLGPFEQPLPLVWVWPWPHTPERALWRRTGRQTDSDPSGVFQQSRGVLKFIISVSKLGGFPKSWYPLRQDLPSGKPNPSVPAHVNRHVQRPVTLPGGATCNTCKGTRYTGMHNKTLIINY